MSRVGTDAYSVWAVLAELFLIGLVINWCASVLQGTRGTRPLRGVLIILIVATLVVRAFGWPRLELLYNYVLMGLAFIGLVVFQPELRRAVIRIGDVRFRLRGGVESQLIKSLVKSVGYLSRNRYGALIAIERRVDLTGWAENGTMIRAEVSANLLNSIFFPNSPLHDLGVIIRGNRIIAANCQFPSAESDELDLALGSRHLAAVGMSYETDALVLIVSEETGVVSLADNGKLTRYLSLDDLADELNTRLAAGGAGSATTKRSKHKHWTSALWAVLRRLLVVVPLTCIIWYLAERATQDDATIRIHLNLQHVDPSYVVDVLAPPVVEFSATFRGPVAAIDRLRLEAGETPLDLTWSLSSEYPPDRYNYGPEEIRRIVEGLPSRATRGLTVTNLGPPDLRLSFQVDQRVNVELPVRAENLPSGVEMVRIDPSEVSVAMRKSELGTTADDFGGYLRVRVDETRLHGLSGTTAGAVELDHVPIERRVYVPGRSTPLAPLSLDPDAVDVTVKVVGLHRQIDNVVVQLYVAPEVAAVYEVRQVDQNEWRINFEVLVASEAEAVLLGPHSFNAFAHVTPSVLPEPGTPPQEQLRAIDVIIVPQIPGVTVVGSRTVRVNLVPRTGGPS